MRALRALELDTTHASTFDAVGYAGAASVLLDLAHMLDTGAPGETVLLVGQGSGGADALARTTGEGVSETPEMTVRDYIDSKEYVIYVKHRSYRERAGASDGRGGVAP